MKILGAVALALVVGALVGAGSTFGMYRGAFGQLTPEALFPDPHTTKHLPPPTAADPRVVVDQEEYDFGLLEEHEFDKHTFVIGNEGGAPLTIQMVEISCSCTSSDLNKGLTITIDPGKTFDVELSWYANAHGNFFRQAATLATNDPRRPQVSLVVTGRVSKGVLVEPPFFYVSGANTTQLAERTLKIFSNRDENFKILGYELSEGASPEHYELSFKPLPRGELTGSESKSGYLATLLIRPGLPIGAIEHTLTVKTNDPKKPELFIGIKGSIDGPITVHGQNWVAHNSLLKIGSVPRSAGYKTTLAIRALGIKADALHLRVKKVLPEFMQVTFGTPRTIETDEGPLTSVLMHVEVPPNSPLVNHLGTQQGCGLDSAGDRPPGGQVLSHECGTGDGRRGLGMKVIVHRPKLSSPERRGTVPNP